ncbi:hypothetical protein [Marinomonas sp. KMM3893]|uniref:hypothetical protein n=1 Tax=Marinomonas sp. KMM3893 TaxID=2530201 RepID=UPI001F26045A|nr:MULTISPECIES: hypothetical protein [Gammaproteobacteria]
MPRTHTKIKEITTPLIKKKIEQTLLPKKIITKRILINKILAYSAIKIKANPPLLYSVLNPDTSSDSPSAKSKGVRLVSAKHLLNQINLKGKAKKINHTLD